MAVAIATVVGVGCGKDKGGTPAPAPSASAQIANPAEDVDAFLADERAHLSAVVYKKLALAFRSCQVTDRGIEPNCDAQKNLRRVQQRRGSFREMSELNANVGRELIGDSSAAVRLQASKMLQQTIGSTPESEKALVDAARKESVPSVLAAMVRVLGSRHKQDEGIKTLLLELAENPAEAVRREALSWFLTTFGEGVPGTFEKVMDHLAKDPSVDLRAYLCGRLYGSSDERAIPLFEAYLTAAEGVDPKLYGACWNGLINAWTGFPKPPKPNKRAYELTLKMLEKEPRTSDHPGWSGISLLRSAKMDYPASDRFGTEWVAQVKDWYKPAKLISDLKDIVGDPKANWMARTSSLGVMLELGEKKSTFESLQKKYAKAAPNSDDYHVLRQVEESLKKLSAAALPAPSASGLVTPVGARPPAFPGPFNKPALAAPPAAPAPATPGAAAPSAPTPGGTPE